MLVILAKMFEDGGRPLARHRAVTLPPSHQGVFSLYEEHDRDLRRTVRIARLDSITGTETLLALYDADVLVCKDGVMTVTGLERDPLTRKATAQSWYVEIVDVRKVAALRAAVELQSKLGHTT
jgi:hypothetical protein